MYMPHDGFLLRRRQSTPQILTVGPGHRFRTTPIRLLFDGRCLRSIHYVAGAVWHSPGKPHCFFDSERVDQISISSAHLRREGVDLWHWWNLSHSAIAAHFLSISCSFPFPIALGQLAGTGWALSYLRFSSTTRAGLPSPFAQRRYTSANLHLICISATPVLIIS